MSTYLKLRSEGQLGNFKYVVNRKELLIFKQKLARELRQSFREGIVNPPKTGRKYPSLPYRSSRGFEFPANQTGALLRSVTSSYDMNSVSVGSNKYYSKYLALGTVKMAPRKMARYVMETTKKVFPRWIRVKRGRP